MTAVVIITLLALAFGLLLAWAAGRFRVEGNPVAEKLNQLLPQTQCGQCGYPGCAPYAEALARGEAPVNLCNPGGTATMEAIADLLGVPPLEVEEEPDGPLVAVIREAECIGCTKCIQACPVDAILGSAKHMHTVIESECTGCKLCVEPCPVDCIDMVELPPTRASWIWPKPALPVEQPPEKEKRVA